MSIDIKSIKVPEKQKQEAPPPKKYTIFILPENGDFHCGPAIERAFDILGSLCITNKLMELVLNVIAVTTDTNAMEISIPLTKDIAETKWRQLDKEVSQGYKSLCSCGNKMIFKIAEEDVAE